jgi:lipoprotein-releasing system permease protein
LAGIIVGVLLCYLQQHFGIVGLGDSSDIFVVDSYPVLLSWTDVVWVALSVCGTGFLITLFTTRNLSIK